MTTPAPLDDAVSIGNVIVWLAGRADHYAGEERLREPGGLERERFKYCRRRFMSAVRDLRLARQELEALLAGAKGPPMPAPAEFRCRDCARILFGPEATGEVRDFRPAGGCRDNQTLVRGFICRDCDCNRSDHGEKAET